MKIYIISNSVSITKKGANMIKSGFKRFPLYNFYYIRDYKTAERKQTYIKRDYDDYF